MRGTQWCTIVALGAPAVVKKFIAGIKAKEYQFFTGESMNAEGMVVLMNYRADGATPYFIFLKHGLEKEKC